MWLENFDFLFHVSRVFSDRLVDDKDMEAFVAILTEKLATLFDQTYHNICPGKMQPIFGKAILLSFVLNEPCEINRSKITSECNI